MYKDNTFDTSCDCGCTIMRVSQWESDEGFEEVSIESFIPNFYAIKENGWKRFVEILKIIWCAIRGKEYYLFSIILTTKNQISAFKKAVANLNENVIDYTRD